MNRELLIKELKSMNRTVWGPLTKFFFFFFDLFIYFSCVGSSFLCKGFLWLRQAGVTLHRGAQAPLVAEHRLQTRRLSSCGSRAQLLPGMWDLPRPGIEPMSPALAGRFSTTVPPGKPPDKVLTGKPVMYFSRYLGQ